MTSVLDTLIFEFNTNYRFIWYKFHHLKHLVNCVVWWPYDADSLKSELKTFINGDYQQEKYELTTLQRQ